MLQRFICFFSIIVFVFSCNKREAESPFTVAKSYCNCVEQEMGKYKDSLINIYDCEKKVFPDSRLMQISLSVDADPITSKYPESTIDSARKFSATVLKIIDTMCFNKFDSKRIKKIPHIPM
jgi:hypothetical protein